MAALIGSHESYALLQVWGSPPNAPSGVGNMGTALGTHALAFTGRASYDFGDPVNDTVKELKKAQSDPDNSFGWDLDITVGPKWRELKQVAASVSVVRVESNNTDTDNQFEFDVVPREPSWSMSATPDPRIVLHVRVTQAGEYLYVRAFHYTVTATGTLDNVGAFL